ncbi:hypothetical protein F66182_913 [Fusarium sp. NRRL 66182]|nr:hypothetical protein F66182_913 [Fusarium sp. NRRL 66182]
MLVSGDSKNLSPGLPGDNFPQPDGLIEIRNLSPVFAVDVSSSTKGRILEQEKKSVSFVTSKLEPSTLIEQSYILPWDSQPYNPISSDQVETLQNGCGTNPLGIVDDSLCREHLEQASIWFLMTDGAIKEPCVNAFANKIAEKRLHGTPAVLIVFGNRSCPPSQCNISAGMSVFAASPHYVFLFHDVWSQELFILQAKGSFASLLPKGSYFKSFGSGTRWSDLGQTTYAKLMSVRVASPIQLLKDEVALPNGKIFDMTSIYNDSISQQERMQLMSSYSALDTILVVAETRGESFLVKLWIESLRRSI